MRWHWRFALRYMDRVVRGAVPHAVEPYAPRLAATLRRLPRVASIRSAARWAVAFRRAAEAHVDEVEAWRARGDGTTAWGCYAHTRSLALRWRLWWRSRWQIRGPVVDEADRDLFARHLCWCSPVDLCEHVGACDPDTRGVSREWHALSRAPAMRLARWVPGDG